MATAKEKALVRELVELTLEINEQGEFDATVDVRAGAVDFRIAKLPFSGNWTFYGKESAYLSNRTFSEEYFAKRIGVFIKAAKQHHKAYRAGVAE